MLQLCELDRGPGEELVAFVIEMPEFAPLVVGWADFFRTDVRKSRWGQAALPDCEVSRCKISGVQIELG